MSDMSQIPLFNPRSFEDRVNRVLFFGELLTLAAPLRGHQTAHPFIASANQLAYQSMAISERLLVGAEKQLKIAVMLTCTATDGSKTTTPGDLLFCEVKEAFNKNGEIDSLGTEKYHNFMESLKQEIDRFFDSI